MEAYFVDLQMNFNMGKSDILACYMLKIRINKHKNKMKIVDRNEGLMPASIVQLQLTPNPCSLLPTSIPSIQNQHLMMFPNVTTLIWSQQMKHLITYKHIPPFFMTLVVWKRKRLKSNCTQSEHEISNRCH